MKAEEMERKFQEYWNNRPEKGWHSQFEDKYDAARAAWFDGWKQGFKEATDIALGPKDEPS